MVQLRPSVFDVAASTLYCLDGGERIGAASCFILCGRILPRERDLHLFDLGAYRGNSHLAETAQDHVVSSIDNFMSRRLRLLR